MNDKRLADRLIHSLEEACRRLKSRGMYASYLLKAVANARWTAARARLGVGPAHDALVRQKVSWLDFVDCNVDWGEGHRGAFADGR
jgi:hypothetical protein